MQETSQQSVEKPKLITKKPSIQFKALGIITFLAFLLFVFIAVWIFYQQVQNNQTLQNFYQELGKAQDQISGYQEQIRQQQDAIKNMQLHLDQLSRLTFDPGKQKLLSEITYLLNLANLYLTLEKDPANSKIFLTLALKQIDTLNNPSLNPLRDILKQNIAQLESVSILDKTALIFKLDALNEAIQQITYTPQNFAVDTKSNLTHLIPHVAQKQTWKDHVIDFISQVGDLIKIRRTTSLPLLSGEQQSIIKANLSSKIMQMQWAVIHSNTELYQNNINLMQKWLSQFFYLSPELPALLKQLKSLAQINIAPNLPDLSDAFAALSKASQMSSTTITVLPQPQPQPQPKSPSKSHKNTVINSQVAV